MSKKHIFQIIGLVVGGILMGLLLTNVLACEINPDGGAGAEFDASLYYTKSELDSGILNSQYFTEQEVSNEIADKVVYDPGDPQWIPNGSGFSNKTSGWAVPSGASVAAFKIRQMSSAGGVSLVYLGETDTLPTEVKFVDGAGSTWAFASVGGKTTIYAWANAAPGSDNLEVSPVMWVK